MAALGFFFLGGQLKDISQIKYESYGTNEFLITNLSIVRISNRIKINYRFI